MSITLTKEMTKWIPHRHGLRYVVSQLVFADFAGSGYRFAKNGHGRVLRFWREKTAREYAATLNARQDESDMEPCDGGPCGDCTCREAGR